MLKSYRWQTSFLLLILLCGVLRATDTGLSNLGSLLLVKNMAACGQEIESFLLQGDNLCNYPQKPLIRRVLQAALKVNGHNLAALRYLGISYLYEKKFTEAQSIFGIISSEEGNSNKTTVYWLAFTAYLRDQPQVALSRWAEIGSWRRLEGIGQQYQQEGQLRDALFWDHLALEVLGMSKPDADYFIGLGDVNYQIGTIYAAQNDITSAIPYYQAAADYMPERIDYTFQLATVLRQEGEIERALKILFEASELHPTSVIICGSLGEVYLEQENWAAAEATSLHCLQIDGDKYWEARVEFNLGISYCKMMKFEECLSYSIASVDRLGMLDPGWEYQLRQNIDLVLTSSQSVETYIEAGDFYARFGKYEVAEQIYRMAQHDWPDNSVIHQRLQLIENEIK